MHLLLQHCQFTAERHSFCHLVVEVDDRSCVVRFKMAARVSKAVSTSHADRSGRAV
jgi:hypothetical protein